MSVAPSSDAETAEGLLGDLRRLYAAGAIELRLDYKRLAHIDSPVSAESDSMIWIYGMIAVTAAAYPLGHFIASIIAFAVALTAYITIGRAKVRRRIAERVKENALSQIALWQKLWRFGGITLVARGKDLPECTAPQGNWALLVRNLREPVAATAN
jgi:hypothetical protein